MQRPTCSYTQEFHKCSKFEAIISIQRTCKVETNKQTISNNKEQTTKTPNLPLEGKASLKSLLSLLCVDHLLLGVGPAIKSGSLP